MTNVGTGALSLSQFVGLLALFHSSTTATCVSSQITRATLKGRSADGRLLLQPSSSSSSVQLLALFLSAEYFHTPHCRDGLGEVRRRIRRRLRPIATSLGRRIAN